MRQELLFVATVLPMVATPGPDILFVASQTCAAGTKTGLKATAGICLGYLCHAVLVALGAAAVLAASPLLFDALRWAGIAYLAYLAVQFLRSALRRGSVEIRRQPAAHPFRRGLLTALLNPKGLMMYFALLPQFIDHARPMAMQAAVLSAIFVGLCATVYGGLSLVIGASARRETKRENGFGERKRRVVDGIAGALMALAALRLV